MIEIIEQSCDLVEIVYGKPPRCRSTDERALAGTLQRGLLSPSDRGEKNVIVVYPQDGAFL